jgi:hypothetical protein
LGTVEELHTGTVGNCRARSGTVVQFPLTVPTETGDWLWPRWVSTTSPSPPTVRPSYSPVIRASIRSSIQTALEKLLGRVVRQGRTSLRAQVRRPEQGVRGRGPTNGSPGGAGCTTDTSLRRSWTTSCAETHHEFITHIPEAIWTRVLSYVYEDDWEQDQCPIGHWNAPA